MKMLRFAWWAAAVCRTVSILVHCYPDVVAIVCSSRTADRQLSIFSVRSHQYAFRCRLICSNVSFYVIKHVHHFMTFYWLDFVFVNSCWNVIVRFKAKLDCLSTEQNLIHPLSSFITRRFNVLTIPRTLYLPFLETLVSTCIENIYRIRRKRGGCAQAGRYAMVF